MKSRRRGHIVNVSTVLSKRSVPYMTAYCMTKSAMNAMDEGLRLEVRPFGIGVTLVCPGLTETDFQSNAAQIGYAPPIRNKGGMSAAHVGRVIVLAVERNRRRVALTLSGKVLLALQRISPALTDEAIHLMFSRKLAQK
jgi:short-subunit dehydrogenase